MNAEKADLRELTLQQRRKLKGLHDECDKLKKEIAQTELARAGLACETCASRCAEDVLQLELRQLLSERSRLQQDISAMRQNALELLELRDAQQLHARLEVERSLWEKERHSLEHAITNARSQFLAFEEDARRQAADMSEAARYQSTVMALREDALQQRRAREESESKLRIAQAELADYMERRSTSSSIDAEKAKLADMRSSLVREAEERRRHALDIQQGLTTLEAMQQELREVSADNARLRTCLHQSLKGLENIERRSAEAEALAASSLPRFRGGA